jgi:hypothetical protein
MPGDQESEDENTEIRFINDFFIGFFLVGDALMDSIGTHEAHRG